MRRGCRADGARDSRVKRGRERLHAQVRRKLLRLLVLVRERELLGVGLEEEVEGVVDGQLGDQVDLDAQLAHLVGKHERAPGSCPAGPAAS